MYIIVNSQKYADVNRVRLNSGVLFSGDSLDVDAVGGEIVTYRNDGMEMCRDSTSDYLRVVTSLHTIKLTNEPEPTPPEPEETISMSEFDAALREGVNSIDE